MPTDAQTVAIRFGLRLESYQQDGDHTDGVQFMILAPAPSGELQTV
ncbi:MAG: hypothetical protein J6386_08690 [Candidatus Synoicihabitans palmerolidicus]|nr:hypothetical protein [Candidatus Synoicihabitans palmerolidicus]